MSDKSVISSTEYFFANSRCHNIPMIQIYTASLPTQSLKLLPVFPNLSTIPRNCFIPGRFKTRVVQTDAAIFAAMRVNYTNQSV